MWPPKRYPLLPLKTTERLLAAALNHVRHWQDRPSHLELDIEASRLFGLGNLPVPTFLAVGLAATLGAVALIGFFASSESDDPPPPRYEVPLPLTSSFTGYAPDPVFQRERVFERRTQTIGVTEWQRPSLGHTHQYEYCLQQELLRVERERQIAGAQVSLNTRVESPSGYLDDVSSI